VIVINNITDGPEDSGIPDTGPATITRLPTGIDLLDRNLNGGLPNGALVYFSANPKSMPEVFLYELTTPRKTFYITTHKNPKYIKRNMTELDFDPPGIEFLDLHDEYYNKILANTPERLAAGKKLILFINGWVDGIRKKDEKNFTIIFDNFSFLLELGIDVDSLKRLLDKIYDLINDTDSICYLMIVKGMHHESVENQIQYWCDVIFDIDLERRGDKIVNKLTLPKIRGMNPIMDYIKFHVTDRISIDTSRDIA
jgi:KaiC/GvpD/RAD55 family RecA-like ATPase